ncbi:MAG TPA: hypothetical protein PKI01_08545 [Bacteroidales bacterium]|nr:hypothetical protein [Bacteroidales bacterium]
MWIIIDKRLPAEAKQKLSGFGNLIEFESSGIAYDAISGHPDIFLCNTGSCLVAAPNTPQQYLDFFTKNNIKYKTGYENIGNKYPATSHYNAVVTEQYLIHNLKYTDKAILEACDCKIQLHTNQSYTRCNLISLGGNNFITSDKNIEKVLGKAALNVLFINPDEILLKGFPNGFFGGCCGTLQNKLIMAGSLKYYKPKDSIMEFIKTTNMELIELYEGKLFDAGGLFFINA